MQGNEPHRHFTLAVNGDHLVNKLGAGGEGLRNDPGVLKSSPSRNAGQAHPGLWAPAAAAAGPRGTQTALQRGHLPVHTPKVGPERHQGVKFSIILGQKAGSRFQKRG